MLTATVAIGTGTFPYEKRDGFRLLPLQERKSRL